VVTLAARLYPSRLMRSIAHALALAAALPLALPLGACRSHHDERSDAAPSASPGPTIAAPTAPAAPPAAAPAASPHAPAPEASPGEPVRLELDDATIRDVLPTLEAVSGEPVIVDPEAEPMVRCGRLSLRTEGQVSPEAATGALVAALERAGLAVIDTKKGIVLQKAKDAAPPPCPR
jgi:hypothetical protein